MPQLPVGNPSVIRLRLQFWILDFGLRILRFLNPKLKIQNPKFHLVLTDNWYNTLRHYNEGS